MDHIPIRWSALGAAALLLVATLPLHTSSPASAAPATTSTCPKHGATHLTTCRTKSTPTPKPKPSSTPTATDYAKAASALVTAYAHAPADTGRLAALEAMMKALHVAVYGAADAPVVPGAGTKSDPLLVEVELEAMVAARGGGRTSTTADLAHDLVTAGVHDTAGAALPTDALNAAIARGITQAQTAPRSPASLAPLLIKQLGLQRSPAVDLSKTTTGSTVTLDPIQRYLISAAILIPWAQSASGSAVFHRHAIAAQAAPGWLFGGGTNGPSPIEEALRELLPSGPPPSLPNVAEWLNAQIMKSAIFDFHPEDGEMQATHYGPAHTGDDGLGGRGLTFSLEGRLSSVWASFRDCAKEMALQMDASLCGNLDLNGTPVVWNDDSIKPYGTLTPETELNGAYAKLGFAPHSEAVPGVGTLKVAAGSITASPLIAEHLGIKDPTFAHALDAAYANQTFLWKVSYHQPRGFKFSGLTISYHLDHPMVVNNMYWSSDDVTTTFSGHLCGSDPAHGHWQIHVHTDDNWHKLNGTAGTQTTDNDTVWDNITGETFGDDYSYPAVQSTIRVDPSAGAAPRIYLHWTWPAAAQSVSPASPHEGFANVPVQEDSSCPATP
jgi:hypothetical protein